MAEKLRIAVAVGIAFPPYPAATKAAASHPSPALRADSAEGVMTGTKSFPSAPGGSGRLWAQAWHQLPVEVRPFRGSCRKC